MTHYLTKLYTPKPEWGALTREERENFFITAGMALPDLLAQGVEVIAIGRIDQSKRESAPQSFFAVWRCPNSETLDALVSGSVLVGWHDYFETVNAAGEASDVFDHLAHLRGDGVA
ncbi:MAG: hypothetical protein J7493_16825 [Porphyrobacter sp.]|nr:hypothetical protein [Porphyrobacter sp.]